MLRQLRVPVLPGRDVSGVPEPGVNERRWQAQVEEVAARYGWLTYHTHDSRRSDPGFPDLVAVKGGRLVFAELKAPGRYPTEEQREWLRALDAAGQEVTVWWPKDLPEVLRVFGPRQERPVLPVRYRATPT